MAVLKGKGTVFKFAVGGTLTAVPGVTSIEKSGEESETMETWSLDSSAPITMAPTGRVKPPVINVTMFYDGANAVHAAIKAGARTPAAVNVQITYTDSGPLTETWSCVGIKMDESIEATKPVEMKVQFTCSGTAS